MFEVKMLAYEAFLYRQKTFQNGHFVLFPKHRGAL